MKKLSLIITTAVMFLLLMASSIAAEEGRAVYRPVWRLLNPNTDEHLYTSDNVEYEYLQSIGWVPEGESFVDESGDPAIQNRVNIYRLYNPKSGEHLYTSTVNEWTTLVERDGWTMDKEGEPMWVVSEAPKDNDPNLAGRIMVYRLFNPKADSSVKSHLLTTDHNEMMTLTDDARNLGWVNEGIAFWTLDPKNTALTYPVG